MSEISVAARNLAAVIERKDPYMRGHGESVARGAVTLASELGYDESRVEVAEYAALLHDVGNLEVEAALLEKPGRLTAEEFESIRQHPVVGANMVRSLPTLAPLAPFIEAHHERWDGLGYPFGLKDRNIPEEARIIAIAESFDAMTRPRAHRPSFGPARALVGLKTAAGSQLDRDLVEAFIAGVEKIVPAAVLESDSGTLSLEDIVRQEKAKLRRTFSTLTQSLLWMYDRLMGHRACEAMQLEINDYLRQERLRLRFHGGSLDDHSPNRVSPEELADIYKAALRRVVGAIARIVGITLARRYVAAAYEALNEGCKDVCRAYTLCPTV